MYIEPVYIMTNLLIELSIISYVDDVNYMRFPNFQQVYDTPPHDVQSTPYVSREGHHISES